MPEPFEAIRITDRVYWVGAIDWAIRDFHGYSTGRGTTYNAYLVKADKVTLIDTVKAGFLDQLMSRVRSVVDPGEIDTIISNHSEMDHSGSLPAVIESVRPSKVVASSMGVKALGEHFGLDGIEAVKDGESLDLGGVTASFYETRMLHWPDSMFTYLADEDLLFSQDGFGMHLASTERFVDELSDCVVDREAAKYYANILLPFSPVVKKVLSKVEDLGIAPRFVCPDHGPVWRDETERIVSDYARWAEQKPTGKVVIAYDTMWGSTAKMARAVADGVESSGRTAKVLPLRASTRSDVATEILDAGALVVGTPTINNQMFPTLGDTLTYLRGLKPKNLIGAAFGSYGWSGEGAKHAHAILDDMGVELVRGVDDMVVSQYVPDDEALRSCRELGAEIGERLPE
ncbi:MAG: FprA family A-type flavoprotein [Candidatus Eisenbacteria bacterium]|nr:FprA family A-type flavoprotein [Candidatus Eisenbacteria bacterium]